jgi:hypothetical protein
MYFDYDFSLVFYLAGLVFFLLRIFTLRRSKPKSTALEKRGVYWLSK